MYAALVALNNTAEALVKFVPEITTLVPAGPLVGVKLLIVGAGTVVVVTVNEVELVAEPPEVVNRDDTRSSPRRARWRRSA